jgi:uncharacterized protein involved in outer membrane biogenesis
MIKKLLLAAGVLLIVGIVALFLIARSMLGAESVRARVQAQLSELTGRPVTIKAAGARVFPRVALELTEVTIGDPAAITVNRASVTTGLRGLFARRIEQAEVSLKDASVTLPLRAPPGSPPGGPAAPEDTPAARPNDAAAAASPPPGSPAEAGGFTIASVRVISVENLRVNVAGKAVRIDLASALDGDRLEVSRLTARSEHSNLEATGAMESLRRLQGAFTVTGKPLDLDELLALTAGMAGSRDSAGRAGPGSADDSMRIDVKVSAPEGRVAGYDFSDLSTAVAVTPARIAMSPLTIGMFGGRFNGTMRVDPARDPAAIEANGAISSMDAAALAAAGGSNGAISGRVDATISLSALGVDSATLLKTIRMSADGAVTDGHIPNLDLVRELILAFGKPSGVPPPGSGSAFSRLGGTFELAGGTLSSNNLAMASRDFDLAGRMTMAVPHGRLDARVDVTLSRELTKQAGTDLRRYAEEDGRVVLPARITGSLAEPVVTVDLKSALGRAFENELKRKGKSLLDQLFKKKGGG